MAKITDSQTECIENRSADFIIPSSKWRNHLPNFDTHEHQGRVAGIADEASEYYHYFTPKDKSPAI